MGIANRNPQKNEAREKGIKIIFPERFTVAERRDGPQFFT